MTKDPAAAPLSHRALGSALRYLRRANIAIEPFLVVREGEGPAAPPAPDDLHCGFLTEADVGDLVKLQPGTDPEVCRQQLAEGKLCFGVRRDGRLIAKMWCDLDEFSFPPNYRRLAPDEAYLFAAFADPQLRGLNVAPLMRAQCYEALRGLGRRRFYSYTDYFNNSARRFKAKLGAVNQCLRVHVALFGRVHLTWTLRRYRSRGESA